MRIFHRLVLSGGLALCLVGPPATALTVKVCNVGNVPVSVAALSWGGLIGRHVVDGWYRIAPDGCRSVAYGGGDHYFSFVVEDREGRRGVAPFGLSRDGRQSLGVHGDVFIEKSAKSFCVNPYEGFKRRGNTEALESCGRYEILTPFTHKLSWSILDGSTGHNFNLYVRPNATDTLVSVFPEPSAEMLRELQLRSRARALRQRISGMVEGLQEVCGRDRSWEEILRSAKSDLGSVLVDSDADSMAVKVDAAESKAKSLEKTYTDCRRFRKEQIHGACAKMIEIYLAAPASTGDVGQACDCVANVLDGSGLRMLFHDPAVESFPRKEQLQHYQYQMTSQTPAGEALFMQRLRNLETREDYGRSHPLYVPVEVSSRAGKTYEQSRSCFRGLVLADGHERLRKVQDYAPGGVIDNGFRGDYKMKGVLHRAEIREGPAHELRTGKDALYTAEIYSLHPAFVDALAVKYGFQPGEWTERPEYRQMRDEAESLAPGIFQRYTVVTCRYDNGTDYPYDELYHYWLHSYPPPPAFLEALSPGHILRQFRMTEWGCPPTRPQLASLPPFRAPTTPPRQVAGWIADTAPAESTARPKKEATRQDRISRRRRLAARSEQDAPDPPAQVESEQSGENPTRASDDAFNPRQSPVGEAPEPLKTATAPKRSKPEERQVADEALTVGLPVASLSAEVESRCDGLPSGLVAAVAASSLKVEPAKRLRDGCRLELTLRPPLGVAVEHVRSVVGTAGLALDEDRAFPSLGGRHAGRHFLRFSGAGVDGSALIDEYSSPSEVVIDLRLEVP